MVDLLGKKRLTLNLSTFPNSLEPKTLNVNSDSKDSAKSPRNFEREVVGLGIVAAMNDLEDTNVSAKTTRTAILAVSPKSQPIPIAVPSSVNSAAKFGGEPMSGKDDMEMSESYTCVISNFGNNLIKKREYFDDEIAGSHRNTPVSSGVFSASPVSHSKDYWAVVPFQAVDFLHSCYLCKKTLQGLDIFMYRGEKAFCSAECRYKQMSIDEQREKCGPGAMKPLDRSSASPCSSPMHFFTGVAAA